MKKYLKYGGIAVGLLILISMCSDNTPTEVTRESSYSYGDFNISNVIYKSVKTLYCSNPFIENTQLSQGEKAVVVALTVENISDSNEAFGSTFRDLRLIDNSTGIVYKPNDFSFEDSVSVSCAIEESGLETVGGFDSTDLLPGQSRKFGMAFRVPESLNDVSLKYKNNMF